jgi:hypothetical protein
MPMAFVGQESKVLADVGDAKGRSKFQIQIAVTIDKQKNADSHSEIPNINSYTTRKSDGKLSFDNSVLPDDSNMAGSINYRQRTKSSVGASCLLQSADMFAMQWSDENQSLPVESRFTYENAGVSIAKFADKTRKSHEQENNRNDAYFMSRRSTKSLSDCLTSSDRRCERQESNKLIHKTVMQNDFYQQRQVVKDRFRGILGQVGSFYSSLAKKRCIGQPDNCKIATSKESRDTVNGKKRRVSIPYSLMRYKAKPDWNYVYKTNDIQR